MADGWVVQINWFARLLHHKKREIVFGTFSNEREMGHEREGNRDINKKEKEREKERVTERERGERDVRVDRKHYIEREKKERKQIKRERQNGR